MCDDLFRDSDDDDVLSQRSWKKTVDGINKDGYRQGLDVGQEESLQEGFNAAFKVSTKLLYQVAEIRGTVSGKLSYNLLVPGSLSTGQEAQLQTLLGDILLLETELLGFTEERYQVYSKPEKPDGRGVGICAENCKHTAKNPLEGSIADVMALNIKTLDKSDKDNSNSTNLVLDSSVASTVDKRSQTSDLKNSSCCSGSKDKACPCLTNWVSFQESDKIQTDGTNVDITRTDYNSVRTDSTHRIIHDRVIDEFTARLNIILNIEVKNM